MGKSQIFREKRTDAVMSILHTQKCQANLFYYIGAVLFTTGIWSTFLLPAANDAAKNIATKPTMELMKHQYPAIEHVPVRWGNSTEKSSTIGEQLELMDCERNATYCHYNYVIFCYYNRDFKFYHTICEPFLNNTQVKMISMFGPPLLAIGGLMVAIGYCYPSDEDKYIFNFARVKNIKKEVIVPPKRSRNSLMANVVPTIQENVSVDELPRKPKNE